MVKADTVLFVGATTIDIHYLVNNFPGSNTKVKAGDFAITVGGPATNAAITNAYLGGQSELWSAVGKNPFREFIEAELRRFRIRHLDLAEDMESYPGISAIITTEETGQRSIVYQNTIYPGLTGDYLDNIRRTNYRLVLLDGFLMETSIEVARQAARAGIPVLMDAGSWKDKTEMLLPHVNMIICSEDFLPPGTSNSYDVFAYLESAGIRHMAITRGDKSILYTCPEGNGELPIRETRVVDTLGAGDILHGAFSYYFQQKKNFIDALSLASDVATYSCGYFGTRSWMNVYRT